jgi:arginine/ornithine transport system permease protein
VNGYYLGILQGSLISASVALISLAIAIVLGLVAAAARLSQHRPSVYLATAYTTLMRGIPELVLMLLVFYGGTMGLNELLKWLGSSSSVDINPFAADIISQHLRKMAMAALGRCRWR